MLPKRPLNQLLPIRFRNGEQVRQFSKPCVRCGAMLNAKDMEGAARLVDDHIAIAVKAHCPECGENFGVACVIDSAKRVRRVVIPTWAFGLYLRRLPLQDGERELPPAGRQAESDDIAPAIPTPPPAPQHIVRGEEVIGRYLDKPIPAWVLVDGRRFAFERIELGQKLAPQEFLLDGCLVYKL